jgi:DNA mismatch endonuclease (patch repair protein)
MVDSLTPEQRSERMAQIRSKNSKAEMIVRRMIHGMRFRFRLHAKQLPGKPDLVFPRFKKVIFVHGCFWHRHDCHLGRVPKSRLDFWLPKLEQNKARDETNRIALAALGWDCLTVWECELRNPEALKGRLKHFLGGEDAVN